MSLIFGRFLLKEEVLPTGASHVKLPKDIDEVVRSLPNPSEWLRRGKR